MLEKPDIEDERIINCLWAEYGLRAVQLIFLPLGADHNTAVYRALDQHETPYFVKLRRGVLDETAVVLPKFLSDQGLRQIIAPLPALGGKLWTTLGAFKLILYPFVEGRDAYEVRLSVHHWVEFGAVLKKVHTLAIPAVLANRIRRETFSPRWREVVKSFLGSIEESVYAESVAAEAAALLNVKRVEVIDLVERATRLAGALQTRSPHFVLCHSDVHAGNMLIDSAERFYIVDWDEPILAPKERDLMFPGSGLMGAWRTPQEEEALFYRGYGAVQVDPVALAYYRYERIVEDIAVFGEQLLLSVEGGEDRARSLHYLKSNFEPDGTIAIARASDRTQ